MLMMGSRNAVYCFPGEVRDVKDMRTFVYNRTCWKYHMLMMGSRNSVDCSAEEVRDVSFVTDRHAMVYASKCDSIC